MRNWFMNFRGWIPGFSRSSVQPLFFTRIFKFLLLCISLLTVSVSLAQAQTEDTTKTKIELPPEIKNKGALDPSETPYQMDVLQTNINRYQLRDYGSRNRFYRQLNYTTTEEFMMREEEGYNRYGAKWEKKINDDLKTLLAKTFKEDSEIMKIWKSLAPFMVFGIWEPYEVPITRVEYQDKVPVERP